MRILALFHSSHLSKLIFVISFRPPINNEENWLIKSIKMNGKLFIYEGPNHPYITTMLDLLKDRDVI